MNIEAEKLELIKLLVNTNNPNIIQSVKEVLKNEEPTDFWDKLSLEQQMEIKKASSEVEQGKVTDYDKFMSQHR